MMKKTYLMPQLHTVKVKRMAVLAGSKTMSVFSTNASTNSNNEYSNALAPGSSGSDGEDW
jgi:hypothetical protein